jgi:predicted AlkP superfamily phosphohydrolase/phosphomutase
MRNKLAIIGIDSLDPYVMLKYRKNLPNFSKLIKKSPTFLSESIFPADTIPAWVSIYTGLHPRNHGVLYVYDVFDPTLSDLGKLDISHIRGRTFWDYVGKEGYRVIVNYPILMYPAWEVNGIMVSKTPFEKRIDWLRTEIDIDVYPKFIKEEYSIPDNFTGLWGGFPGLKNLKEWAELGKQTLDDEKNIGLKLYSGERWDLFFIYFSILDIIQHRLWRFFDENDPKYYKNHLSGTILDYYKMVDNIVGEFIEACPDMPLIVMSDHGHRSRPYKTVNINEYLREKGYLVSNRKKIVNKIIRKTILEVANKLNIEHWLIKFVVNSQKITKVSKLIYSSAGFIDKRRSIAYLSDFAGIKSYPHGGIEINKDLISNTEYEKVRDELIKLLLKLKTVSGKPLMEWVKRREELYPGKISRSKDPYPDIVFELKYDYSVGWDLHSGLYGKAYDHNVASGGHARDGVFLIRNIKREIRKENLSIIDVAPTILDFFSINWKRFDFDGKSLFR